jgi:hypothetical protein
VCYYRFDAAKAAENACRVSLAMNPGVLPAEICEFLTVVVAKALRPPSVADLRGTQTAAQAVLDDAVKEYMPMVRDENLKRVLESKEPDGPERCWNWTEPKLAVKESLQARGSSYNGFPVQHGYFGNYCLDALAVALHCVYHSRNFTEAIGRCVNVGGEACILGALTGQIAGALYGYRAVDERLRNMVHQWDEFEIPLRGVMLCKASEKPMKEKSERRRENAHPLNTVLATNDDPLSIHIVAKSAQLEPWCLSFYHKAAENVYPYARVNVGPETVLRTGSAETGGLSPVWTEEGRIDYAGQVGETLLSVAVKLTHSWRPNETLGVAEVLLLSALPRVIAARGASQDMQVVLQQRIGSTQHVGTMCVSLSAWGPTPYWLRELVGVIDSFKDREPAARNKPTWGTVRNYLLEILDALRAPEMTPTLWEKWSSERLQSIGDLAETLAPAASRPKWLNSHSIIPDAEDDDGHFSDASEASLSSYGSTERRVNPQRGSMVPAPSSEALSAQSVPIAQRPPKSAVSAHPAPAPKAGAKTLSDMHWWPNRPEESCFGGALNLVRSLSARILGP